MKLRTILISAVAGLLLFGFSTSQAVAAPLPWFATDGDVNTIHWNMGFGFDDYALFDDDDNMFTTPLMIPGISTIDVVDDATGNWTAIFGANSISLGNDGWFHFAWKDTGDTWILPTHIARMGDSIYQLKWAGNADLSIVTDVAPVPVPGALLLLFSGLIGLVGVSRLRKK